MDKAISYINVLPETKSEIKDFKEQVINELLSGNTDIMEVAIKFKAIETLIKELQSDYRFIDLAVEEAEKNGKEYEYENAKIQVAETGIKYDYSNCDDSEWDRLNGQLEDVKAKIKERENTLKSLKEPFYDGEGIEINPPTKTSKTNIKITLK